MLSAMLLTGCIGTRRARLMGSPRGIQQGTRRNSDGLACQCSERTRQHIRIAQFGEQPIIFRLAEVEKPGHRMPSDLPGNPCEHISRRCRHGCEKEKFGGWAWALAHR